MEDTPLVRLRKAVIEQKKVFLPLEAEEPGLSALHQAVATYDQFVSQVVIAALQSSPVTVDAAQLQSAKSTVDHLLADPTIQANHRAEFYRSYASRLERMLALAQAVQSES